MTLIEGWLNSHLKGETDVTDITGAKIYPQWAPQNASPPFITFTRSATARDYNANKSDGVPTAQFEINLWVKESFAALMALTNAVRLAIDGARYTEDGFQVRSCVIEDERDVSEPAEWGSEEPTYGRQFVLSITYTETVVDYT